MDIWQLIIAIGLIVVVAIILIWVAARRAMGKNRQQSTEVREHKQVEQSSAEVGAIFDENFRQELRNRGLVQFEKIISENAMFLQQDLRITASQANDFIKEEINKTLRAEFKKYEQSIDDAKEIAVQSIGKTREAIEEQRQMLSSELRAEVNAEKARYIQRFEQNMAEIINHYVLAAVGDQINLDDQLEFILGELEQNKAAILEDVKNGA
ncbi:MAG: hypothetical protein M3P98_02020 [bacterium]|nr:hypothetical protein [bacterium]